MLADFCKRTFLTLWSYSNPYKEDGDELCDLLAVFGNYVFIFFDRMKELSEAPDKDPQVLWNRWKRIVIDKQVKTAHGAERYIRSGRPIFLDPKGTNPFPLTFDKERAVIHKIIVAHGAKDACERASPENIYGSLAITYTEDDSRPTPPFHINSTTTHDLLNENNAPPTTELAEKTIPPGGVPRPGAFFFSRERQRFPGAGSQRIRTAWCPQIRSGVHSSGFIFRNA